MYRMLSFVWIFYICTYGNALRARMAGKKKLVQPKGYSLETEDHKKIEIMNSAKERQRIVIE